MIRLHRGAQNLPLSFRDYGEMAFDTSGAIQLVECLAAMASNGEGCLCCASSKVLFLWCPLVNLSGSKQLNVTTRMKTVE